MTWRVSPAGALVALVFAGLLAMPPAGWAAQGGGDGDATVPWPRVGERAEYYSDVRIGFWPHPRETFFDVGAPGVAMNQWMEMEGAIPVRTKPINPAGDGFSNQTDPTVWFSAARRVPFRLETLRAPEPNPIGAINWIPRGVAGGAVWETLTWWVPAFPLALAGWSFDDGEWVRIELDSRLFDMRWSGAGTEAVVWSNTTEATWDGVEPAWTQTAVRLEYAFDGASVMPISAHWDKWTPPGGAGSSPTYSGTMTRSAHWQGAEEIIYGAHEPRTAMDRNPTGSHSAWIGAPPGDWDSQAFAPHDVMSALGDDPRFAAWEAGAVGPAVWYEADFAQNYRPDTGDPAPPTWELFVVDSVGFALRAVVSRDHVEGLPLPATVEVVETFMTAPPPTPLLAEPRLTYAGLGRIVDALEDTHEAVAIGLRLWPAADAYPFSGAGIPVDSTYWVVNAGEPCLEGSYRLYVNAVTGQLDTWVRREFDQELQEHPQSCLPPFCRVKDCVQRRLRDLELGE